MVGVCETGCGGNRDKGPRRCKVIMNENRQPFTRKDINEQRRKTKKEEERETGVLLNYWGGKFA